MGDNMGLFPAARRGPIHTEGDIDQGIEGKGIIHNWPTGTREARLSWIIRADLSIRRG
jgi:hypothetical protein